MTEYVPDCLPLIEVPEFPVLQSYSYGPFPLTELEIAPSDSPKQETSVAVNHTKAPEETSIIPVIVCESDPEALLTTNVTL